MWGRHGVQYNRPIYSLTYYICNIILSFVKKTQTEFHTPTRITEHFIIVLYVWPDSIYNKTISTKFGVHWLNLTLKLPLCSRARCEWNKIRSLALQHSNCDSWAAPNNVLSLVQISDFPSSQPINLSGQRPGGFTPEMQPCSGGYCILNMLRRRSSMVDNPSTDSKVLMPSNIND